MRERLLTGWSAVGALLLFLTMFVHVGGAGAGPSSASHPTTQEAGGNGYRAAMQWLKTEQVHVISLRERFDTLTRQRYDTLARQRSDTLARQRSDTPTRQPARTAAGNLLIVTLPTATPIRGDEFRALDRWVRAGNTVLIMAALDDDPAWAHPLEGLAAGDLNLLSGLEFETAHSREPRSQGSASAGPQISSAARLSSSTHALPIPQRATLVSNRAHAYLEGVGEAIALSDYPVQSWRVKLPYDGFVLALAHQRESGEEALWTRYRGAGRIVISAFGSLFTNRAIGLGDNSRLLANLVAASVGSGGTVLFDDLHQGLGAAYDPARFYRDSRLYWTVAILSLGWLSWVLGSTRLRAPVRAVSAPRQTELVQVTGRFFARVLSSSTAADLLLKHFLKRWPWTVLECHPRVLAEDLRQLRDWHRETAAARSIPLRRLHDLLVRIDAQLTT